uniref:Cell wall hydroxyproline-rich glycoprotein n=1 Tax=Aegilops tauschii TaxID=37682 RepID=M8CNA0_AEGTA
MPATASPPPLLLAAALLLSAALLCSACPVPLPKQTADNSPRLQRAYVALQALKRAITDDPKNLTGNWCGPDVCAYFGVFCAPSLDDPCARAVAGVDLNHGDLAGTLPFELGHLTDLAVLHLNSNRFAGGLPDSLPKLSLLHELDVSNNLLSGGFPQHILCLPNVKYVDIRFNNLCGPVPPAIFDKKIDALFINDNHFDFELPENFGNSPASRGWGVNQEAVLSKSNDEGMSRGGGMVKDEMIVIVFAFPVGDESMPCKSDKDWVKRKPRWMGLAQIE